MNGVCGASHDDCSPGTPINTVDGASAWTWQCQGQNGGSTASCSQSKLGTVSVTSNVAASWTITGPSTINGSGTSQESTSKPIGSYTITWNPVSGYATPPSQTLTLTAGGMISFSGYYSNVDLVAAPVTTTPIILGLPVTLSSVITNMGLTATPSLSGGINMNIYGGVNHYGSNIIFDGTNIWETTGDGVARISLTGEVDNFYIGSGYGDIVSDGTNMWLTSTAFTNVTRLSPSITTVVPAAGFPMGGPDQIAFDGTNMWVTNTYDDSVTKIAPMGGKTFYHYASSGVYPYGIAFDGTNMWTANWSGSVTKISPTGVMTTYSGIVGMPDKIAFDGTNMWTSNYSGDSVTKISPTGGMTTYSGTGHRPSGIAFDGTNMWTSNYSGDSVTKIDPTGVMTTYGGFNTPQDIVFDGTSMWVNSFFGTRVVKVTPIPNSFSNLFQVASAPNGGGTVTNVTPPVSISGSMASGVSRPISTPFTFTVAGNYSVRACADTNILGVGTITESEEKNNCSSWTNISAGISSKTLSVTKNGTGDGFFTMTDGASPPNIVPSTGINCAGMPCTGTETVLSGATRIITAHPSFSTVTWTGCNTVVGNVCTLIITTDRAVTATFTLVSPSVDTLTAVPNPVSYATPSTLSWTASGGVVACYITGGIYTSTDWYGTYVGGASGSVSTGNLIADTPYTVNCHNGAVWALNGKSVTVTIPPPPTNQVFTCAPSGTAAIISWTPAAGYNTFYLRTRQPDGSTVYYDDNNYVASSYTLDPIIPGQSYNWWVHSKDPTGAYSSWTIQTLKCTGTLKICEGPFLRKLGVANIPLSSSSKTVLTARYGLGDCSTDPAVSAVWAETNTPDNAISLSNPLTGTTVTVTSVSITGPPPKWEDITATYSGNTETARALVSCVARTCSSLSAQTSTYCPSELQSFDNNCSGMISCPGTRNCDYNYTEASP